MSTRPSREGDAMADQPQRADLTPVQCISFLKSVILGREPMTEADWETVGASLAQGLIDAERLSAAEARIAELERVDDDLVGQRDWLEAKLVRAEAVVEAARKWRTAWDAFDANDENQQETLLDRCHAAEDALREGLAAYSSAQETT